jgi:N-acetylglucosamine-6-phosphate deacetylase
MKLCIINGNVILKDQVVKNNVYIENGTIIEISKRQPTDEKIIDAKGRYVSPGFIDIHMHGRGGSDSMYPTFADLNTISKTSLKSGVTSMLPTTMTMGVDDTQKAVKNIVASSGQVEGSKIIGIHMEGPFFNVKYKGAQPEEYMIPPTIENFNKLSCEHIDFIKKVSLAPELEGSLKLISYLVSKGVVVSSAHTNAKYEEMLAAIDAGVTSGTHTFNAMTPLTHREPGVVGAIMEDDRVYAELILDGIHVSYPAAKVLIKAKGVDKVALITDSMEAAGLGDGQYNLGNQAVYVKDNAARLESGSLAGSVLSMNTAVYNAYTFLKLPIYDAVRMATLTPASSLNIYDIGEIAVHKKADIILFDKNIDVSCAIIDGKVMFGG